MNLGLKCYLLSPWTIMFGFAKHEECFELFLGIVAISVLFGDDFDEEDI